MKRRLCALGSILSLSFKLILPFTKAYVAESSGTKGGLPGPNFYVDLVLFGNTRPQWLELGPNISWRYPKLKLEATFAVLQDVPKLAYPAGGPLDILDGLEVAKLFSKDSNVLSALRAAEKT
jgi:hypothetical protein